MENPEQWQKLKQIVGSVLEKLPNQRAAYLDEVCGSDRALRSEVESLLSAYESSHVLSEPSKETEGQALKSLGPYRLLQKLGEGGMGQVWLAEQVSPVRREVALKLIKAGMYDDSVLRRFQSERQSLAIMDHPAIAKVFDAGATPEGQPYFVMEYVSGVPITDYCDQKKLKIRARLELFIQACEGVQHAHQKAIIHRDLKPENILVVEVDGKPMPRIIDFGLAKAITPHIAGETLFTQVGSFVGTPGYLSPEQADPAALDIDTRTDVYSLGAVLYVLLTGSLPIDPRQWQKLPLHEVLRQLREQDPPRPSTKVRLEKESSRAIAESRGMEPAHLASLLHGDLDWITMKALEKDRARRYGSPSELAADVYRYLRNEPVVARPASAGYQLRKYVLRHRIAVGVTAGLALLLVGFGIVQAAQLRRITRERDRANRITEFMTRMFKVSDPSEARGNTITAREILDKASKEIDSGLAKDPEVQAQMMYVMGDVYMSLGLDPQTQALLSPAVEAQRRTLGPENPDTLRSASLLGAALSRQGHYTEAEKLLREALAIQRRVLGREHPDILRSMDWLADLLRAQGGRNRYEESEKLYHETLEIRQRVLGPEHRDTISSMGNLARILWQERKDAEAEKLMRETLDIQRRVLGAEHPDTLSSMDNLAFGLLRERRSTEAEQVERECLVIRQRILGREHIDTLSSMHTLAVILARQGRYPEAETLQREVLQGMQRTLGPEHPETLNSMNSLAMDLMGEGHYREAEKLLRETRAIQQRVLGPDNHITAVSTYNLGALEAVQGHREQALSFLREAVDHGLDSWMALRIEKDEDLKSLYGDPGFAALVARAKERAAVQKTN
jgi:eukaryotic-like serine/threonine-protein kinase